MEEIKELIKRLLECKASDDVLDKVIAEMPSLDGVNKNAFIMQNMATIYGRISFYTLMKEKEAMLSVASCPYEKRKITHSIECLKSYFNLKKIYD